MSKVQAIAQPFLDDFYKGAVSGDHRFALWMKHNRAHMWHNEIDLSKVDGVRDTYFTMALYPRGITKRKQHNASAIFGVWLDVDCGDKGNGQTYFPTVDEALSWVTDELAGKWSHIIHSGGGLHVYLMFDETFWIESEEDRIRAQKVVKGFHRWADARCPYTIDSLIDLSRVMRLPGTMNTGTGEMCHVMDQSGVEIALSDLEELIPEVEIVETGQMAGTDGEVDIEGLKKKIELLRSTDAAFNRTWKRDGRFADKSPSGYCMSIANIMACAQFNDGEIISALKLWRGSQTDAKPKGEDWYLTTLGKAREIHKEDAVGNKVAAAAADELGGGAKLDAISAVFKRKVTRIVKRVVPEYKGNKEKCNYVIYFDKGNLVVPSTAVLMSQHHMKALAFEEANLMMAHLKPNKWADFLSLILAKMEESYEAVEGNLAFNIEQEIGTFLAKKTESCLVVDDFALMKKNTVYEEGGIKYFPWSSFRQHLSSAGYSISNRQLAGVLKSLGGESRQFNDEQRTRLWCLKEKPDDTNSNE